MTSGCNCRCCEVGAQCARVLVLSPKDNSDATRLWARFAENGPQPVSLKVTPQEQRIRRENAEPVEPVLCRACGSTFALFVYLAKFLRDWRAPAPYCRACERSAA